MGSVLGGDAQAGIQANFKTVGILPACLRKTGVVQMRQMFRTETAG